MFNTKFHKKISIRGTKIRSVFDKTEAIHLLEDFDKESNLIQAMYTILLIYGVKPYKYTVADITEKKIMPLSSSIHYQPNGKHIVNLLHETGEIMKRQYESLDFVIYLEDESKKYIFICPEEEEYFFNRRYFYDIEGRRTVAIHVYRNNEPLNISTSKPDLRFPEFQDLPEIYPTDIMSVPMSDFHEKKVGIFEMFRDNSIKYNELEFQRFQFLAKWMAEGMQRNKKEVIHEKMFEISNILSTNFQTNIAKKYQNHNDDFLNNLVVTAKLTFDAESANLFLKNTEGKLYKEVTTDSFPQMKPSRVKLRLSKEIDLAKVTADSNVIINYKDVYNDARFDNEIDITTGKLIRSVLATPIGDDFGQKLGVLQVINKLNGDSYTSYDEILMRTFNDYSSLWLHYKSICNEISNVRILSDIFQELVVKQANAAQNIEDPYSIDETIYMPSNFLSFEFHPFPDHMSDLSKFIYYIILMTCKETFASNRSLLYLFIDIVAQFYTKKNGFYSFTSAFLGVHFIFVFIKRYEMEDKYHALSETEKLALLVAALCCYLDCESKLVAHISKTRERLMQLYGKYAIQKHQFWLTKILIEASGLLKMFSKDQQNEILEMIEEFMMSINIQCLIHHVLKYQILTESEIEQNLNTKLICKDFIIHCSMFIVYFKVLPIALKAARNMIKNIHLKRAMVSEEEVSIEDSLNIFMAFFLISEEMLKILCKKYSFLEPLLIKNKIFMENVGKLKTKDIFQDD